MREQRKQVLLPKLRFPEFRDAGEWEKTKLGDIGKFIGGGTPSKENNGYWEGKNPWISSSDISEDSIHDIKISRFITDEAIQETATKLVPANSILLVSRVGVGKLAVTKKPICTSQDFTSFTPTKDDLVFVAYYLKSLKNAFLALNQGMAIKGFTKEDVSSLEICLPNLIEQQKIADCLTFVDELITAEAQKLDTLKAHKKGLMQQLFPAEGETLPKLRFPEFRDAGEWDMRTLGKVAENLDKLRVPITSSDRQAGDVPYYGASGVVDYVKGFIFDQDLLCVSEDGANLVARTYPIAFSISGKTWVNNHAHVLRFENRCTQKFVEDYLNSIKLDDFITGMAQPKLNKAMLDSIPIPYPDVPEQQKIADCLSSLDDLITAQTQKLAALKAHKKGLMQQLFPSVGGVDGEAGRGGRPVVDEAQG
jgi:type I restriction enzyme S subunit